MKYSKNNRTNIILILLGVLMILGFLFLWLQGEKVNSDEEVIGIIYPSSLNIGDTIYYEEKTPNAQDVKWEFGDGAFSSNSKGAYLYKKPGFYQVKLTIDDKYSKYFSVLVSQSSIVQNQVDSLYFEPTYIDAPTRAIQFENVIFRAISTDATMYNWKFGETNSINSRDKLAIYSYQQPGIYTVKLYTDKDMEPVLHQIEVLPAYNDLDDDVLKYEDNFQELVNDMKIKLQNIADKKPFNPNFNYIVNNYLCNNVNVPVKVNDEENTNFYYYCMKLRLSNNKIVENVEVEFDKDKSCVTSLKVIEIK